MSLIPRWGTGERSLDVPEQLALKQRLKAAPLLSREFERILGSSSIISNIASIV